MSGWARIAWLAWGTGLAGGWWLLMDHRFQTGQPPRVEALAGALMPEPDATPQGLRMSVFLRADCPCSVATLENLARLPLDRLAALRVVLCGTDRTDGPLARRAASLPGAELIADPAGERARSCNATTSGEIRLECEGVCCFRGGVTRGRGYAGENPATASLRDRLSGGTTRPAQYPVFGCSLAVDGSP